MEAADIDESTDCLYNTASDLMKQFEKVLCKIKQRDKPATATPAVAPVTSANSHICGSNAAMPAGKSNAGTRLHQQQQHQQQQQQQQQQLYQQQCKGDAANASNACTATCQCDKAAACATGGKQQQQQLQQLQQQLHQQLLHHHIATNESNFASSNSCQQRVCTEPSELRLVLKLDTWIADNGSLVVRPSIYEDRGDASASNSFPAATGCPTTVATAPPQPLGCRGAPAALGRTATCCSDNNSDDDYAPLHQQPQPPQQPPQQQQQLLHHAPAKPVPKQSDKRLRNLSNSVQEIAKQLGAINSGGAGGAGGGNAGRRLGGIGGSGLTKLSAKPQRPTAAASNAYLPYHTSGGDGCQTNNHHDSVSDHMSDHSDANSSVASDSDSYRHQAVGQAATSGPAGSVASNQEPTAGSTRALIQRLHELIKNDPTASADL